VLPIDHGPAADPHAAFGEPLTESIWLEPYPDAELGLGLGLEAPMLGPDARYETARERRARLRRRAPTAPRTATRGLDPPRRAGLLGPGDRRRPGDDAGLDRQRAPAGSQGDQGARSRPDAAVNAAGLGDSELRQIVNRFADAWERKDVDAVVAMLVEDARMSMPPWPSWYSGRDGVASFLRGWPLSARKRWRILPTGANAQPAVAGYLWDEQASAYRAETIIVLTFQAARIEEITAFRSPELFPRFGLPEQPRSTTTLPPEV
jgi:RNA polymerase sigma-70 factor, ECF subfamily